MQKTVQRHHARKTPPPPNAAFTDTRKIREVIQYSINKNISPDIYSAESTLQLMSRYNSTTMPYMALKGGEINRDFSEFLRSKGRLETLPGCSPLELATVLAFYAKLIKLQLIVKSLRSIRATTVSHRPAKTNVST